MRSLWSTILAGALLWFVSPVLAQQCHLADGVNFQVPLLGGQAGGAILLPTNGGQFMVVAVNGSPPTLFIYRVTPELSPQPGPGPQPQPQPHPQPGPEPQPQGPISLIWIEETASRTPDQAAAIVAKDIREALQAAGWTLRVADVDVVNEEGKTPDELKPYIEAARTAGVPRLFAVDSKGAEIFVGKAPSNVTEFKAILKRLGLDVEKIATEASSSAKPQAQQNNSSCSGGGCPAPSTLRARFRLFR